jgi:hypothetical protein
MLEIGNAQKRDLSRARAPQNSSRDDGEQIAQNEEEAPETHNIRTAN